MWTLWCYSASNAHVSKSLPRIILIPSSSTSTTTPPSSYVIYGRSVMSAQMLEVALLGVETVFPLESDA